MKEKVVITSDVTRKETRFNLYCRKNRVQTQYRCDLRKEKLFTSFLKFYVFHEQKHQNPVKQRVYSKFQ